VLGVLVAALAAWALAGAPAPGGGDGDAPAQSRTADQRAAAAGLAPRATVNRFDGARAFRLLREQVIEYGPRPAGSAASRRLAVRLRDALPRGRFEAVPGWPRLRNVVGHVPGRRPAIVVGAHYDTQLEPEGHVGANDGAAGTAAVVELARQVARAQRPRNAREIRFVLFDGEELPEGCEDFLECGLRGSAAYARRHADDVHRMILLDYVGGAKDLRFPREDGSNPQLWSQLRAAARRVGTQRIFPAARYSEIIDDHTSFTRRGIPAINLIDFEYEHKQGLQDTVDKTSARSLDAVGETVFELVRTLQRR
jgi:acetylornithine deacetylase/succinyl-diaminopimelate desuccinylase-like protein